MKETTKRILSFVLAVVMVVGLLPGLSLNVSAAGDTHYLMFATDRHADTQVIGNIINNMESTIGENELEYLGLGGDMVGSGKTHPDYDSSEVLSEVTNATSSLSAANVDIVAGIHDMNVNDDAGIVLSYQHGGAQIYEGEDYYVYGVEEYCISEDSNEQNWTAQADAFESWANSDDVDPSKVIIVLSHYPLHAWRDDNDGAMYWHWALNAVATGNAYGKDTTVERDIVFFHGHNHTKDSKEYVYNVGDTMEIQNLDDSEPATIYYTYATAGYLNENKKATLMTITDDQIVLTKYGTSGTGTAMATVDRVVNESVVEPSEPEETEVTLTGIRVVNNKDTYYVGDELDITVFATYSNNTEEKVTDYVVTGFDSSKSGMNTVTVKWNDKYQAILNVNVQEKSSEPVLTGLKVTYTKETLLGGTLALKVTAIYDNGAAVELAEGEYTVSGYDPTATGAQGVIVTYETQSYGFNVINTDAVTVLADGMKSLTVNNVTETLTETLADALAEGFVAYDIVPDNYNVETNMAVVSMPAPEGANAVYYWNPDTKALEPVSDFTIENGKAVFTTNHFSTYVVGESTEIDVDDPKTATGSGTTGGKKETTVYVLASSLTNGGEYLIVNINSAGSGYAMGHSSGTVASDGVTVKSDGTNIYIETSDVDSTSVWTATTKSNGYELMNGSYYLEAYGSTSALYIHTSRNYSDRYWVYSSNKLYYDGGSGDHAIQYSNSTFSSTKSDATIYIYQKQVIETDTTVTTSGTYSIAGNPAEVTKVVKEGSTAELGSVLTFTPADGGTVTTTENPTGVTYSKVENGDPNGVISDISGNTVTFSGNYGKALVKISYTTSFGEVTNYITVEASAPYYTIQLHLNENGTLGEEISEPVALKGIKAGDNYSVWAVVKEHTSENPDGEDMGTLGNALNWSVSDESIATINTTTGVITFTGDNYGTFTVTVSYKGADSKVITDTITISATDTAYIVPGDGTNDFPEYPNEGAVRFDKTATAVGNFSQTGIAKVELSMTGVPYTTGSEIDVVLMLDMTGSMTTESMAAAEAAALAFAKQIILNTDDTYNENRISIQVFNKSGVTELWAMSAVTESTYSKLETAIESASTKRAVGGTPYSTALSGCKDILDAAKKDGIGNNRSQYCVFVSDGTPTSMTMISNYDAVKAGTATSYTTTTSESYYGTYPEYYSTLMKDNGVTVYGVYTSAAAGSSGSSGGGNGGGNGGGSVNDTEEGTAIMQTVASSDDKVYVVEDYTDTSALTGVFSSIAVSILQAATNVTVEDKIADEYTVNFSFPNNGITTEDTAGLNEWYIQVLEYNLDPNKERTGTPAVLENFTFDANGALKSHTVNGVVTCELTDCTHVTFIAGKVSKIEGTYFTYTRAPKLDANNIEIMNELGTLVTEEYLTWKADKLSTTELALQYFVYLDNSAGLDANKQVDPGTYNTNEYATLTYDNYKGNRVQQEYPIPQMTWNGAHVTYVFYLVNEDGQPVNRAGRVIPFTEAIYVTDPVTFNVTWNELEGSENMLAEDLLASVKVPEVYSLYDTNAYYEIRVYQTEGVDSDDEAVNYNYFIIEGSAMGTKNEEANLTINNLETTKVFNTKAGTKYDDYGAYSATGGSYKSHSSGNSYTANVTNDIDYASTTVAFAVVWKPELVPDVVVVDYGLDVIIDVATNDAMASGVVGVRADRPNVTMNSGTYTSAKNTSVDVKIGEMKIGTAKVENMTSVRFSLDKTNGMQFSEPAVFYYESDVNYYTYDSNGNATLNTTSMYSSVTVIPATTIYYEDEYVKFTVWDVEDKLISDTEKQWQVVGTSTSATQDQDRPGASKISEDLDADNNYGYDDAYAACTQFSLGSARKVTVDSDKYAEAQFTFAGTGFDLISLTSNTTGVIMLDVYDAEEFDKKAYEAKPVKTVVVDTYYGYTKNADGEWVATPDTENSLYQVPVAEVADLPYDTYTVVITAAYNKALGHSDKASSYDFYLDAIRIYDPANDGANSTVIENAYKADGEGWPSYIELRNKLIEAESFGDTNADGTVDGMVFIDGMAAVNSGSISKYVSYGPNNEVYLAAGQSVAFILNAPENIAKVQIGAKSADGKAVQYSIQNVVNGAISNTESFNLSTATDMYYDMTAWKNNIVVITNVGTGTDENGNAIGGILSITNIKSTYTSKPTVTNPQGVEEPVETSIYMTPKAAEAVLMALKPQPVNPFADVTKDQFFYESVLWAVGKGITNGVDSAHFGPYLTCNRAQVVTFLWRAAGSPAPASRNNPFKDVPENSWYTDAVLWAVENGITNGLSANTFGPDALCNRAQVVTFLWRANGSKVAASENPFVDVPADAFYRDAVVWALSNGITAGATATTFDPNGTCMRAHVVTFLYRAEQLPEVMAYDDSYEF